MKRNDGKSFEEMVRRVFEAVSSIDHASIVTKDEKIAGPDGTRQFDVVLRSIVGGEEIIILVECKDYSGPVNVTAVDALHSKMRDVNANKGVLVSRNGFSRTALQKAKRVGISLCTIDLLSSKLESPLASLPIVSRRVNLSNATISFVVASGQGEQARGRFDINTLFSGLGMMDVVRRSDFGMLIRSEDVKIDVTQALLGRPLWLNLNNGHKLQLESCSLRFEQIDPVYFGYAADIPEAVIKLNSDNTIQDLFLSPEGFRLASGRLSPYRSFSEIPKNLIGFHVAALIVPEKIDSFGGLKVFGRKVDEDQWVPIQTGR